MDRRIVPGLAGCFFGVLCAGCSLIGPDFQKPKIDVAPTWIESGDSRVRRTERDHRDWWRVFKDPVLNRLITQAYHQNLPLRVAGLRILEARAQLGVAIGDFYPQKQQGAAALENIHLPLRGLSERLPAGDDFVNTIVLDRAWVSASWELDVWGKFRRAIESADAQLLAAVADYDSTLVTLTADVANLYIRIRTLEKKLQIAHDNVNAQLSNLKIAEAKFRGGSSSQRDVEQAKTVLGGTQASIPSLESQLRQSKNALCLLLGLSPRTLDQPLGSGARSAQIPTPPVNVAIGIPADLLRRRPDIRKAEMAAAAQSARIGVVKANLYPAFSLSGSFGFISSNATGNSLSDIFQWSSHFYRFGPAVQWNLFNYGQITNQVRGQDALLEQSLTDYQNRVLSAQREVEDGLIAFLKSQDAAEYLAQSTAAAQRSLNLATLQYREGIADFTTVLTAEQSLLSQQDSFATTLGDIASSLVTVYRALGGGWQIREGEDFIPAPVRDAMARRTNWGDLLESMPVPKERPTDLIRAPDW